MNQLIQVEPHKLGAGGAREVEQTVDNLRGPEGLLRDLFEDRRELWVAAQLLREHLCVAGDDREWRVDFVRHAGGKQPDRRELLGLSELSLQLDAVGDVVDQDDASDDIETTRQQRGDRDVGDSGLTGGKSEAKFVQVVRPACRLVAADGFKASHEVRRQNRSQRLAQSLLARAGEEHFHLRIPAFDATFQIDGKDADVDRFNDVLVEILQLLEFVDLRFKSTVKLRVLDRDTDISGERFENLHVFGGEEVAIVGAAQADDRDRPRAGTRPVGDAAR